MAVHPAGSFVYVTNERSNTVSVIDTATDTLTATVLVGTAPRGVAVHPAGTFVYVANLASDTVSVIDAATNTVIETIPVGLFPQGVAVHPAGTFVYVANRDNSTVSVIDTATHTVIATVSVEGRPFGIATHPEGTFVYVANFASDTVSIIDTATHIVTDMVAVGAGPIALGQFIGPARGPDLSILAPAPVVDGEDLVYTLLVENNSDTAAASVTLQSRLSPSVTFVSATPGCTHTSGTVTCSLGSLGSGDIAKVTIVVRPTELGSIVSTFGVTSSVADPETTNNSARVSTTVQPVADLSLTMADSPDPVVKGSPLTYTLTVTNQGPATATGVTLQDPLPSDVTFVSAAPTEG
ncbi:MAG: beta-propeller fold lactonase family protein, partial [bacterium]